ncbi:Ripening-related protein 3 [Rhynchospora pubera]|uniref:Ripening-related protein 3 n=1 Tax=Rhynchospora pubera TaxID=906938 RepID=A0AAV8H7Z0_9POAL|nr:Ripening-related protein 3 [Rhynchospora pubera]
MANKLVFALVILFLLNKPNLLQAIQHRFLLNTCNPSGYLPGTDTDNCNTENDSQCCQAGQSYPQYQCSPDVSDSTSAILTLNSFENGGDGGDPPRCDNTWHDNSEMVVALSTGWYSGGSRCLKNIKINANGKSVVAMVVDECDSVNGCDKPHSYQPPCRNNIVDASQAVWDELGISGGEYDITWSDA